MSKHLYTCLISLLLAGHALAESGAPVELRSLGAAVERQTAVDNGVTTWAQDAAGAGAGDRIEVKKVLEKKVKTVKLRNVVPPIQFGSGEAQIPDSYVGILRDALERMKGRTNVRLHLVGNSDNVPLMGAAREKYGDNIGLSRERAGVAAEYFQRALRLPPESISYEGVGDSNPVASNSTAAGKARNRRVEVEVWYDEIEEALIDKEVVIAEAMNRVKVCRVETVCKLRYKEGHAKRTRVKNLIPPLRFDADAGAVPAEFQQKVAQALENLRGKQNVTLKFIGYTDNAPLTGRDERIYGTHGALSKARARRVALAIQDALRLPSAAVESDGRGGATPVAGNDTEAGRALNRRVEVEFWYDDMLTELPNEPQICPEAAGAELVTRVYQPPSGPVSPVAIDGGQPVIHDGYAERLRQLLEEVKDKTNPRLRFIGYTNNQRLDRRTAMIYGDDIGLSTARARRVMESIRASLALAGNQAEFEGRGFVQSDDVVNSGFVESDSARVEVQVVYEELASLDEADAVEVTRLTREVKVNDPFGLNLMRVSVDGKPVDDPGKSSADIQRCTDVALDQARIEFKFDDLAIKPRLNASAFPVAVRYQDDPATELPENLVRFRAYSNYPAFIARAEIRLFGAGQSVRDTPMQVLEVGNDGTAEWQARFDEFHAPKQELKYLLRVYDRDNRFDETAPQSLWLIDKAPDLAEAEGERELLVGYGENRLATENIPLKGGTITVTGDRIPADHRVTVAGRAVPVGKDGQFVVEEILPSGFHTVEVAVLDSAGNGDLFLRDVELKKSDWFYVGIADVTASLSNTSGPAKLVTNDKGHYDDNLAVDGRFAGYVTGKFGDEWRLTASADTKEGPIDEIFSNLGKKSPDAMFRRVDPNYAYPTFGDDSTVEETAPTLGKFYLRAQKAESYGLWGNSRIGYFGNDLAIVDRDLYGANLHLEPPETTTFGEKRLTVDAFAAQPGTVAGRDEFRGTGGSLYYLRHQDILTGSERLWIEIRDKDAGHVIAVKNLAAGLDYTIDYLQGRVLLSEPLSGTSTDGLLVESDTTGGNGAYLVARYEFTPGFDELDNFSNGGRVDYWLSDHVKLGATGNNSDETGNTSHLAAADITLRKSADTWVKLEQGASEGAVSGALDSQDGGFSFAPVTGGAGPGVKADARRVDASIGFADLLEGAQGKTTLYLQAVDAGYSAPGIITAKDTEKFGGTVTTPVTGQVNVRAKVDRSAQRAGLETGAQELDIDYLLDEHWTLSSGVRNDSRTDRSAVVPLTQVEGDRTDLVVQAAYDSKERWTAFGYVQDTVDVTGERDENSRVGSGGTWRITDRFNVGGELSGGSTGPAAKVGTEYLYSDRTNLYTHYSLENERNDNGVRARKGNLTSGFKSRYTDTTSVYMEERYAHGDVPTGLTHSAGVDLAPNDRWNYGASIDYGVLRDNLTGAKTERQALGVRVGYGHEAVRFSSALEYRVDNYENLDLSRVERTTWLTKNGLSYQLDPDWRFISKLNYSESTSSQGEFYDGTYTEAVFGYGYRPVENDRLNALVKYTYFYNLPSPGQVTVANSAAAFVQKSHVVSVDTLYDLTDRWTVGGKYAYRHGMVSADTVDQEFFLSRAHLFIASAEWHFARDWETLVEGRMLDLPDAKDRRSGALLALYREVGGHLKMGLGYNFTDFSDDLTDLDYQNEGVFINVVGKI